MLFSEDKSMKFIIISSEMGFDREARAFNKLFDAGASLLHLRKPQVTKPELADLLQQISTDYYDRIVLHDHFELAYSFGLKGIHLNRRNPNRPEFEVSSVSCSCHSLKQVSDCAGNYNYVFLSPIFDSISKSGYNHAFTEPELRDAQEKNIINENVIALGGINETTIPLAKKYGFGGMAVLGALWEDYSCDKDEDKLLQRFKNLHSIINQK